MKKQLIPILILVALISSLSVASATTTTTDVTKTNYKNPTVGKVVYNNTLTTTVTNKTGKTVYKTTVVEKVSKISGNNIYVRSVFTNYVLKYDKGKLLSSKITFQYIQIKKYTKQDFKELSS